MPVNILHNVLVSVVASYLTYIVLMRIDIDTMSGLDWASIILVQLVVIGSPSLFKWLQNIRAGYGRQ